MPETEPKTTFRCIQNPAKHLKWSKKEQFSKIIIAWNYFQKTQYV